MFCPVCLSFAQQVEAITVVNGTQYCAAHGVEALQVTLTRSNGPMRRQPMPGAFTPPAPPVLPPSEPAE